MQNITTPKHKPSATKIAISSILGLVLLNGCAMTQSEPTPATRSQQQLQMDTILQQQDTILAMLQAQPGQFNEQEIALAKLSGKLEQLNDSANKSVTPASRSAIAKNDEDQYQNMTILGQEEWVWSEKLQTNFKSRVDTGAATSSLNATEIVKFERDGKNWVKFNLSHQVDDGIFPIEAEVVRTIKIRQSNSPESVRRYVVSLSIELGQIKTETEFTLADRSRMEFPVLLGRTFLKDIAVVDVAQEYTQKKRKPKSAQQEEK
ncbi:MAG: hypothetical protein ACI86X_001930 [Moritella sp.]|jgi:hypothetical protein